MGQFVHYNCSNNRGENMKKLLKRTAITIVCIVLLFIATLPFAGNFIQIPILQIPYIVYLNTTEMTEFEVQGSELHMSGTVNGRTYDQFLQLLDDNPKIETLVERNVAGSLDDDTMIKLAYLVRRKGLNTKLLGDSRIYSGGVDLFLAGVERTMEHGAVIGVHSWSDGIKEAIEYPRDAPEHEQNRKYIVQMLGKDDFYWFTINAAPADDMYEMKNEEIMKYGLLTQPVQK